MEESADVVTLWTVLSVLSLSFPITYMLVAAWYRSTVGRMVMGWSAVYSLHVIITSVAYFYDHDNVFRLVRTITISWVAVFSIVAALTMIYMNAITPKGEKNE